MFLVDEKLTVKEVKKELNEIVEPLKLFNKRWSSKFEYEDDAINSDQVAKQINEIIEILECHENEKLRLRVGKLEDLLSKLNILSTSVELLNPIETFLIFHVLLTDKTQLELSQDKQIWDNIQVDNISPAKINLLYQGACLRLLELIKFNQLKTAPIKS